MKKVNLELKPEEKKYFSELHYKGTKLSGKLGGLVKILDLVHQNSGRGQADEWMGLCYILEGFAKELNEIVEVIDGLQFGFFELSVDEPK